MAKEIYKQYAESKGPMANEKKELTQIERLIKAYITKNYAHSDEVIITGGVNLNGCGEGI